MNNITTISIFFVPKQDNWQNADCFKNIYFNLKHESNNLRWTSIWNTALSRILATFSDSVKSDSET